MSIAKSISTWYFQRRYAILFYSLLTTIAFEPVVGAVVEHSPITRSLLGANLVIAVLSSMTGRLRRVLFAVALTVWVAQIPLSWFFGFDLSFGRLAAWTIVAMMSAASSVLFAIRARRVDSQHVYATLSAYLLAGLFFGTIHQMIETAQPGSYSIAGVVQTGAFHIEDAIYFSFVTLATLGYGDILPVSGAARGISTVEAIAGQLYLAVMIARIVSLYVPRQHSDDETAE